MMTKTKRSRLVDEISQALDNMGAEQNAITLAFTLAQADNIARSIGKRLMCDRWVGCHWH